MKVILHIGSGKTGTSSIQQSLTDSRGYLLKNGFLYPVLDGDVNHNYLTAPFRPLTPRGMLQRYGSREKVIDRADRLWKILAKRARRHPHHTLVLSAEALLYLADVDGFCRRLNAEIPSISEVDIVVYLRRPSSHFAAKTQQSLRASSKVLEPTRLLNAPALRAWQKHGQLRISEFRKPLLRDQDVVSDFWHNTFPAVVPVASAGSVNENVSLSGEGMALLQRYRCRFCADQDGLFLPQANSLIRLIGQVEKSNNQDIVFERPSLHADVRDFIDYSTNDNNELADEFGFRFSQLKASQAAPPLRSRSYARVEDIMKVDVDKVVSLHEMLTRTRHLPFSPARKLISQLRQMDLN
ncbi:MAG: hypothetical protein AAGA00_09405 [Pseudomonadota bacterium]